MRSTPAAAGRLSACSASSWSRASWPGALFAGLLVPAVAAAGGATRGSIDWFNDLHGRPAEHARCSSSRSPAGRGRHRRSPAFYDENRTEVAARARSARTCRTRSSRSRTPASATTAGSTRVGLCAPSPATSSATARGAGRLHADPAVHQEPVPRAGRHQGRQGRRSAGRGARDASRKLLEIRRGDRPREDPDQGPDPRAATSTSPTSATAPTASRRPPSATSACRRPSSRSRRRRCSRASCSHRPRTTRFHQGPKRRPSTRRNIVLDRMHELGLHRPTRRWQGRRAEQDRPAAHGAADRVHRRHRTASPYFCEYVREMIATGSDAFPRSAATQRTGSNALNRGGLTIHTTIDLKVQDAASQGGHRARADRRQEQGAVGRRHGRARHRQGARDGPEQEVQPQGQRPVQHGRSTTRSTRARRLHRLPDRVDVQGVHAGHLAQGRQRRCTTPSTRRRAPPSRRLQDLRRPGSATRSRTPFKNSEPNEGGKISVLDATANSVNTAFVAMETQLALCDIAKTADSIGVHLALGAELRLRPDDPDGHARLHPVDDPRPVQHLPADDGDGLRDASPPTARTAPPFPV